MLLGPIHQARQLLLDRPQLLAQLLLLPGQVLVLPLEPLQIILQLPIPLLHLLLLARRLVHLLLQLLVLPPELVDVLVEVRELGLRRTQHVLHMGLQGLGVQLGCSCLRGVHYQ